MNQANPNTPPKPTHLVGQGRNQDVFSPGARRWDVAADQEGFDEREPDEVWVDEAEGRSERSGRMLAKASACLLLVAAGVVVAAAYRKGGEGESADAILTGAYDRSAETVVAFAEAFVGETDPHKRLAMARDAEGVENRMKEYPEDALSAVATSVELLERLEDPPRTAFIANFDGGSQRMLIVVEEDEGLKVDWDAFANHGSVAWDRVATGELETGEVRVVCREDEFYAGSFADDSRWHCFRLSLPGTEDTVFAYAERDSLRDRYLTAKLREDDVSQYGLRSLLRLRRHGEAAGRPLYEIECVLAFGWILPGSDLERRWQDQADVGVLPPEFGEKARLEAAFPGIEDTSPEALFPELGGSEN